MRYLFYIGHPGHVHFFKNVIRKLILEGHEVKCFAIEKESNLDLLSKLGIKYDSISTPQSNIVGRIVSLPSRNASVYRIAKDFKPDLIIGIANVYGTHIAKILDIPSFWFHDSEASHFVIKLTKNISKYTFTPDCYKFSLPNQIRYPGYHELAYLHPNNFSPDKDIRSKLGLNTTEKYFVLRFGLWSASHDAVHSSHISSIKKFHLIKSLEKYGKVFVSSGEKLPALIEDYRIKLPPHNFHDILREASLVVTDSQTTTAEAGDLGVPAVRCNSYVNKYDDMSYIEELESRYGLVYSFNNYNDAFRKIMFLVKNSSKGSWLKKKEKMLNDKIDVCKFQHWLFTKFPFSVKKLSNGVSFEKFK